MRLTNFIRVIFFLAASAYSLQASAAGTIYNEDGLAIGGYDPVAYFKLGRAVWGRSDITAKWNNVTWQFDNKAHRDAFTANPEKYAPQYGGFCAYAAAKGSLAPTDANSWAIIDGKLYLNYSPSVQNRWKQNPHSYIDRANRKWPNIETRRE